MIALVAALFAGVPAVSAAKPPDRRAVEADLKFAAEMARQGLWREALFRWERALAARPGDPRILNNIGVAAEALGQLEKARDAYARAAEASREREVVSNFELFKRSRSAPGAAAAEPRDAAPSGPPPAAEPPSGSTPGTPTPPPPAAPPPPPAPAPSPPTGDPR